MPIIFRYNQIGYDSVNNNVIKYATWCEKMSEYSFTLIIERLPEGEYLVTVPALPGCFTEGSTFEQARLMAKDAIQAYCASLLKHNEPIPVEQPTEQFIGQMTIMLETV